MLGTHTKRPGTGLVVEIVGVLVVLGALLLTRLYSYLLFHSIADTFAGLIFFATFVFAWNTRRFLKNNYLAILGIAYLFIGIIDLVHMLAYKGMGIFTGYDANLPTQLWIASRYLLAITLCIAPIWLKRSLSHGTALACYALVTCLLLASIFVWPIFPDAYREGSGLTDFKKVSEYIVSALLLVGIWQLWRNRTAFDGDVFRWLTAAVAVSILCELAFTLYTGVYDSFNLLGHLLSIVAAYLLYRAIIQTGLIRPYDILFRDLKLARDELEARVRLRTLEIESANSQLSQRGRNLQILHDIDRSILATASVAAISENAVAGVRRATSCRRVTVVLFEAETGMARLMAISADSPTSLTQGATISVDEYRHFANKNEIQSKALMYGLHSWGHALAAEGMTAYTSVPLLVTDHPIGYLNLWTDDPTQLTPESEEFAQQVADSLAVAIHNARLFDQLTQAQDQLRELSERLVDVQENERRTLARELHDQAGQSLTALKIGLGMATKRPDCPPELGEQLNGLLRLSDEIAEELHRLAMSLRPASLDRLGLVPAVEQLCHTMERSGHLTVEMVAHGLTGYRLPATIETTLYRVIQEALGNAMRHSAAGQVGVLLERTDHAVRAVIEDDGRGFNVVDALQGGRLGLTGIRERAEMLGGQYCIESAPGAGCTVFVEVPLTTVQSPAVRDAENN
jgi:signal transduction histidine kinase